MPGIAIFDADGTLHEGFSIFPLYETFADDGFIPRHGSEALQEVLCLYEEGSLDYRTFVTDTLKVAAQVLRQRKLSTANEISRTFFIDRKFQWFDYARMARAQMIVANTRAVLLTAEPQFIASGISSALSFDENHSSIFAVDNDATFSGTVLSALDSTQKGEITRRVIADTRPSFAFGDSEGDIGMLEEVDVPVCIQPSEGLRSHAFSRGWRVIDNANQLDIGISFDQVTS